MLLFDFSKSPIGDDIQYREFLIGVAVKGINMLLKQHSITVERLPDVKYDDSTAGEAK